MDLLKIMWVENTKISKLLGAPFGLPFTSLDMDIFFFNKIHHKITY